MAKSRQQNQILSHSTDNQVAQFLAQARRLPARHTGVRGRLIFALDATASRQATWDQACEIQGEMFAATMNLGGLYVQLLAYCGFKEFLANQWVADAESLYTQMSRVCCAGGLTQIARVLHHAVEESRRHTIKALVFIGDSVEETPRELYELAGQLRVLGIKVFCFQEGDEPTATLVMREIARLSGGAYCSFDQNSAQQLRDLLAAVAVYAAGGRYGLRQLPNSSSRRLLEQLPD